MNDRAKPTPRLRQALIVAVCVLAEVLFLYLLLRDRPGSANDYLDDSTPYTFDSSANRTFRTVDSRLAVVQAEEVMRRLGLAEADKTSMLMVGDRKYDVLGAAECGLPCVGVEFFGYAAPGELAQAGAAAVVHTAAELETYILTH